MYRRSVTVRLGAAVATLLLSGAGVAHAAVKAPRSTPRTLFFANEGSSGNSGCTPAYVLDKTATGDPCSGFRIGTKGTCLGGAAVVGCDDDVYSSVKKVSGFTLNAGKPVTGTVYITNYALIYTGTTPSELPGLAGATVTVSINGTVVGSASGSGQITAPGSSVAIPLNLHVPASLNGKKVKSIEATVHYTDGTGLTGVSYGEAGLSKLVLSGR